MPQSSAVKWSLEADYLQACNCDYGCPCEFEAPPTQGNCEAISAWRIDRGRCDDVGLDGLCFALAARWPRAIHQGGGTAQLFVDERADERQRDALLKIASGQAGGLPFEIIATTFSKVLEPRYVPIGFELRGKESSVRVGDALVAAMEPIKNPVTGEPESVRVEHATGFVFKGADCVSAREMRVSAGPELDYSHPNKCGFVARVKYGN
jgi:hypothetical protein